MSEILDIVHKFTYITDKTGIESALKVLQEQGRALGIAIGQTAKLKSELTSLGDNADKSIRDKIIYNIKKSEDAQVKYTSAIQNTITSNKRLEEEYLKETSLIGGLVVQMNELKNARVRANDVEDIARYMLKLKHSNSQ